jgi:hypothetical protein
MPVQASNLVTNGNFTAGSPTIPSGQAGYQAVAGAPGGGTVPTGWQTEVPSGVSATSVLDCVIVHNSVAQGSTGNVCGGAEGQNWGFTYATPNAPGGGNYFGMDGDSGYQGPLYQTISGLTVGQTYVLTFDAAVNQQSGISGNITAYWGVGFFAGSNPPPTTASSYTDPMGTVGLTPSNTQTWQVVTENFVASATTETLAFLAGSPEASGPPFALLSNVSLTSTPEPGTMALLGLGLLSIPALSRLYKKRG